MLALFIATLHIFYMIGVQRNILKKRNYNLLYIAFQLKHPCKKNLDASLLEKRVMSGD